MESKSFTIYGSNDNNDNHNCVVHVEYNENVDFTNLMDILVHLYQHEGVVADFTAIDYSSIEIDERMFFNQEKGDREGLVYIDIQDLYAVLDSDKKYIVIKLIDSNNLYVYDLTFENVLKILDAFGDDFISSFSVLLRDLENILPHSKKIDKKELKNGHMARFIRH